MPLLNRRQFIVPMAGLAVAGSGFDAFAGTSPRRPDGAPRGSGDANGFQLRPCRDADRAAVEALVEANYGSDPDWLGTFLGLHRHDPSARRWRASLVAEQQGKVVAVGSAGAVLVHDAANANVIVDEAMRRRGIGTALVSRLRAQAAADVKMPLMTSIRPHDQVAYEFTRSCGMSLLMRSRRWVVDPTSWAVEAWCEHALRAPHGFGVLEAAQVDPDSLIEALSANYNRAHRSWIAVKQIPFPDLRAYWSPALVPGSGLLVMDGGKPIGMSVLLDLRTGPLYISPLGTFEPIEPIAREFALTSYLVARCLRMARDRGSKQVIVQRDDEDGRLMPVFTDVPLLAVREGYAFIDGPRASWPLGYEDFRAPG